MSLERIGVKFVIQLVTMTESQVFCIKGIDEPELKAIIAALARAGCKLSRNPLNIAISPSQGSVLFGKAAEPDCFPAQQEAGEVKVGVLTDVDTGHVKISFPRGIPVVSFRPKDAIGLSELIARKARTLMN